MTAIEHFAVVSETVRASDYVLSDTAFEALVAAFRALDEHAPRWSGAIPDYNRREYFVNVHRSLRGGSPLLPSEALSTRYSEVVAESASFAHWFALQVTVDGPLLMPNRWLAHQTGFRHRVIHVFIDPVDCPGHTFVQLRSLTKPNAPGCFDVAVGGHVDGLRALDETVQAELGEELGLDTARDIASIDYVGQYDYEGHGTDLETVNVEQRSVYRAVLAPGALGNLHFADGEVAALCQFRCDELESLLARYPERFASGLLESYAMYRNAVAAPARQTPQGQPS